MVMMKMVKLIKMTESETTIHTVPDKDVLVYDRTASDVLKITDDKLKLKLIDLKSSIESKSNIFCYMGIMVTMITVLITANFTDWILKAELWQAMFVFVFIFSMLLTSKNLFSYLKNKKDIDSLISDIKKGE